MYKNIDFARFPFYRIVKLSSPNINNILLVGCVLTYSTVLMKTTEALTSDICKVYELLIDLKWKHSSQYFS